MKLTIVKCNHLYTYVIKNHKKYNLIKTKIRIKLFSFLRNFTFKIKLNFKYRIYYFHIIYFNYYRL